MRFSNLIKTLFPVITDEPKIKLFSVKLCETIDRAEKARKSILHSSLPDWARLDIACEMLCIIDDLRELQIIKLIEEERIWDTTQSFGLF